MFIKLMKKMVKVPLKKMVKVPLKMHHFVPFFKETFHYLSWLSNQSWVVWFQDFTLHLYLHPYLHIHEVYNVDLMSTACDDYATCFSGMYL